MWKIGLSVVTACSWAGFLWLDIRFQQVMSQAVRSRSGTYGELYGPLSFFRPTALFISLVLTVTVLCLFVYGKRCSGPQLKRK